MSSFSSTAIKTPSSRIRLGYYEGLTTAPAVSGIESTLKGVTLRRGTEAEIRTMFANQELEAALLPTPDVLKAPNCVIIPGSVVAAMGASMMFVLVSKKLPTEIQRVLVDQEDHGGEYLARLILAKKLMVRPEFVRSEQPLNPAQYDLMQNDGFDAYVLTGANCFYVRRDVFSFTLDLTLTWYELTRLPYVINCWVVRKGLQVNSLGKELADVARRNEGNRELPFKVAEKLSVMESGVRAVYEKAFHTRFDPTTIASIRQFAKELMMGRILPVQTVTVYTPPAVMGKAGVR